VGPAQQSINVFVQCVPGNINGNQGEVRLMMGTEYFKKNDSRELNAKEFFSIRNLGKPSTYYIVNLPLKLREKWESELLRNFC